MHGNRFSGGLFAAFLFALVIVFCTLPLFTPSLPSQPEAASSIVRQAANAELESTDKLQVGESIPEVVAFAEGILANMKSELTDYEAELVKRERIGGSLGSESRMLVKIRNKDQAGKPSLAAYLEFLTPAFAKGREVIWVANENDGKIIAHEGGFKNWTRMELDPNGSLAMMGNRYPITEIGLLNLMEKLIEKANRDQELASAQVSITSGHLVGDRKCHLVEVRHPEAKEGLEFHLAQIFLDAERMIPLRYAAYLWPEAGGQPPLEEEYTYLNVRLNVGLPSETFSPDNPKYEFP